MTRKAAHQGRPPSLAPATFPALLDRTVVRRRFLVDRRWGKLANWHQIATRDDRLARNYLVRLTLVPAVMAWT